MTDPIRPYVPARGSRAKRFLNWMVVAVVLAIALHIMARALLIVTEYLVEGEAVRTLYHGKFAVPSSPEAAALVAWSVLFAPVIEEVIFRRYIFQAVRRIASHGTSLLVPSLLFAAMHIREPGDPLHVMTVVWLFAAGIVYQLLYVASKSIWTPIAAHTIGNAIAVAPQPLLGQLLNDAGLRGMEPKIALISAVLLSTVWWVMRCCRPYLEDLRREAEQAP